MSTPLLSESPPIVPSSYKVMYDASLVEEAVLRAEPRLPGPRRSVFRGERDRLYDVADPDEREARFEELHGRWFIQLGLDRPLHRTLAEQPMLLQRSRCCRVLRAVSGKDEMADVMVEAGTEAETTLVVRLRPE